jgi:hypothetical protein
VFGPGPPRYSRKERIEGAAIEVRMGDVGQGQWSNCMSACVYGLHRSGLVALDGADAGWGMPARCLPLLVLPQHPSIDRHHLKPHTHPPFPNTQVTLHPHRGQATSADREREGRVRALLEEAVVTERYPRTMIHVVLQALGDDGGLLACALNVRASGLRPRVVFVFVFWPGYMRT